MLASLRSPELFPAGGPILTDQVGVPRYWVAVWLSFLPAGLASSTLSKKLNHIEALYKHSDTCLGHGYLDDALAAFDVEALCSALEGFFLAIKNRRPITAASEDRWQAALQFVLETVRRVSRGSAQHEFLSSRLAHFELLNSHLHVGKRRRHERIRSLPAEVVEALYEMLHPESADNPFRAGSSRWRVYIVFMLLLHQGLRRGELLGFPVDVIKSGFDRRIGETRYWMTVRYNEYEDEDSDPRYTKPSIKNAPSVRQIPVSENMALLVHQYIVNYRGRPDHSFLINSQKRRPLSHEGVTKIFEKITASLSKKLRKSLLDHTGNDALTPHDLRHTSAVVRLNQLLSTGVEMRDALERVRGFFGWSRDSEEPLRYARAVFEDLFPGFFRSSLERAWNI